MIFFRDDSPHCTDTEKLRKDFRFIIEEITNEFIGWFTKYESIMKFVGKPRKDLSAI